MSYGQSIPLSDTTVIPASRSRGDNFIVVPRSILNVLRSRLLIPARRVPVDRTLCTSCAACTSPVPEYAGNEKDRIGSKRPALCKLSFIDDKVFPEQREIHMRPYRRKERRIAMEIVRFCEDREGGGTGTGKVPGKPHRISRASYRSCGRRGIFYLGDNPVSRFILMNRLIQAAGGRGGWRGILLCPGQPGYPSCSRPEDLFEHHGMPPEARISAARRPAAAPEAIESSAFSIPWPRSVAPSPR